MTSVRWQRFFPQPSRWWIFTSHQLRSGDGETAKSDSSRRGHGWRQSCGHYRLYLPRMVMECLLYLLRVFSMWVKDEKASFSSNFANETLSKKSRGMVVCGMCCCEHWSRRYRRWGLGSRTSWAMRAPVGIRRANICNKYLRLFQTCRTISALYVCADRVVENSRLPKTIPMWVYPEATVNASEIFLGRPMTLIVTNDCRNV